MDRLYGKTVLVTGAANGLGKEQAILFARHGAKVIISDVDINNLEKTKDYIALQGYSATSMFLDVSNESSWLGLIKLIKNKYRNLDAIINNAGIMNREGINEISIPDFRKVQQVNVEGTLLGMKHGLTLLKEGGSIVNISSISGIVGTPSSIAYHSSKGAVCIMTKSAALEFAKYNIRVNSILPGVIESQMSGAKDNVHPLLGSIPLKKTGLPSDVAYGALFLISNESKFITGTELIIDGGYSAQ